MVERLRTLTVERSYLTLPGAPSPLDGGLISRAPKGPLLNSRACIRILLVEHLKVLNSRACLRILLIWPFSGGGGLNISS